MSEKGSGLVSDDNLVADEELTQEQRDELTLAAILQSREQGRTMRTSRVKIKRLGAEFVIRALDENEFQDIANLRESYVDGKLNAVTAAAKVVAAALVSPRMDAEYLNQLGVKTVDEALRVSLLPGEIIKLQDRVSTLSGMAESSVETVGN